MYNDTNGTFSLLVGTSRCGIMFCILVLLLSCGKNTYNNHTVLMVSNAFSMPTQSNLLQRRNVQLSKSVIVPISVNRGRNSVTVKRSTLAIVGSTNYNIFSTMLPLISADDVWGNWSVLCGIAAMAQMIGRQTWIGKLLGPPVTAMALSFVAATIGILTPGGTLAAKTLQLLSLQYATPLILLGADFRRNTIQRCGPLVLSFLMASLSTIIACCIGWAVSGTALTMALGKRDGIAIAAALLAKNVGGGINYIAVCRTLNVSPNAVAAGLCVDNIFALLYFPVTSILANGPDIVANEADTMEVGAIENTNIHDDSSDSTNASVQRISIVLFLSTILLWIGEKIGRGGSSLPACTLATILFVSCVPPSSTFIMTPQIQKTANELGLVALYLFFATAGAPGIAVAQSVRTSLIPLTIFLSCLYSFHGAILYAIHQLLGPTRFGGAFQIQRLLVSSSAAIGGPATAVALATEANWKSLMVPSVIIGNIGYAIATFCGLAFHAYYKP
jgi:uncharacterized membrane protein